MNQVKAVNASVTPPRTSQVAGTPLPSNMGISAPAMTIPMLIPSKTTWLLSGRCSGLAWLTTRRPATTTIMPPPNAGMKRQPKCHARGQC